MRITLSCTTTWIDMRRMTILAILMILSVLSLRGQELYINLFQIDRQQCSDKPLLLEINFAAEYQNDTQAALVLSAQNGKTTLLWEKYALEPDFAISKKIPSHLLNEAPLKCYIFNPKRKLSRSTAWITAFRLLMYHPICLIIFRLKSLNRRASELTIPCVSIRMMTIIWSWAMKVAS